MAEETSGVNQMFFQLVLSLQSAAWYQMGKMASPVTGKIERDLEQAKVSIDLLVMLQEKTKGNLRDDEKRILDSAVYNLQMNFLDESNKKDEESPENKTTDADPDKDENSTSEDKSEKSHSDTGEGQ